MASYKISITIDPHVVKTKFKYDNVTIPVMPYFKMEEENEGLRRLIEIIPDLPPKPPVPKHRGIIWRLMAAWFTHRIYY